MVVTNHGDIDGKPTTGIWFTEFSEPFEAFRRAGAQVTVVSPRGGPAPVDPRGYPGRDEIAPCRDALAALNATAHLSTADPAEFDGIFFPGGHGPMFDLATDREVKRVIAEFWEAGKPVSAVCHGPAALLDVRLADGSTLLSGKCVTGFSRAEDAQDALFAHMPFSLQDRMEVEGATFLALPPKSCPCANRWSSRHRTESGLRPKSRPAPSSTCWRDVDMALFAMLCTIDETKLDLLGQLRGDHYAFLLAQRHRIRFGRACARGRRRPAGNDDHRRRSRKPGRRRALDRI